MENINVEQYINSSIQRGSSEPQIIEQLVKHNWEEVDAVFVVFKYLNKTFIVKKAKLTKLNSGSLYYELPPKVFNTIVVKNLFFQVAIFIAVLAVAIISSKAGFFFSNPFYLTIFGVTIFLFFVIFIFRKLFIQEFINSFDYRRTSVRYYFSDSGLVQTNTGPLKLKPWADYKKMYVADADGSDSKIFSNLHRWMGTDTHTKQYTIRLEKSQYYQTFIEVLPEHLEQIQEFIYKSNHKLYIEKINN